MKSKYEAFNKKHDSLKSREEQLEFTKQYMLSLPPEEIFDFIFDGIHDIGKIIKENELTVEERKSLSHELQECIAILKEIKARRPREAIAA